MCVYISKKDIPSNTVFFFLSIFFSGYLLFCYTSTILIDFNIINVLFNFIFFFSSSLLYKAFQNNPNLRMMGLQEEIVTNVLLYRLNNHKLISHFCSFTILYLYSKPVFYHRKNVYAPNLNQAIPSELRVKSSHTYRFYNMFNQSLWIVS